MIIHMDLDMGMVYSTRIIMHTHMHCQPCRIHLAVTLHLRGRLCGVRSAVTAAGGGTQA